MGKYLIAGFVTEITPKFNNFKSLLKPFEYFGNRDVDITLTVSDKKLQSLLARMVEGSTVEQTEEFAYANAFCKAVIKRNAMLIHSSALVYNGNAYLFSAQSGVGKSTHTRLWQQAFGDKVYIINDDKPVVRIIDNSCIAYGTPFDGGSGIAKNENAPLRAIIFIERGEENTIRKATHKEIVSNLYLSTIKFVDKATAASMLANFDKLISLCDFYILTCNTDISAAYTAFNTIIDK